ARLCLALPGLRAAGEGRLPDVVRSAQWLGCRVPEVPDGPGFEVRASGTGEGAVGPVGAQRRRALGRRHGHAAPGADRRGLASFRRADLENRTRTQGDQGTPTSRSRTESTD